MNNKITLCSKDQCTGCAACAGACNKGAITFIPNSEGFLYPSIDEYKCVECGLCMKTCPVLSLVQSKSEGHCYAAWTLDNDIRTHSSSGGLFSEFARFILLEGGLVVGASLNDETGYVEHIPISQLSELYKLQGSKYVQSTITTELLKQVKTYLHNGQKVLFTGTPCQIAGVKSLTNDSDHLYTMDVVCHGVPSPKLFELIHRSVRTRVKGFVNYNFRQLSTWSVCSNVNVNVNGRIINRELQGVETCYQDAFLKGYLHRENCYQCKYASTSRVADITVADFWGIGEKRPIPDDHKLGCSMLLVNTSKGGYLFGGIKDRIYSEIRDIDETIEAGNEQLQKPSARPCERNTFYEDAYCLSLSDLIVKYNLKYNKIPSLWIRIKSCIKQTLTQVIK